MPKPRSKCLDYAAYLAVRLAACVLQALPLSVAATVVRVLAGWAYHLDRRHREVAKDNLRQAFRAIRLRTRGGIGP